MADGDAMTSLLVDSAEGRASGEGKGSSGNDKCWIAQVGDECSDRRHTANTHHPALKEDNDAHT